MVIGSLADYSGLFSATVEYGADVVVDDVVGDVDDEGSSDGEGSSTGAVIGSEGSS